MTTGVGEAVDVLVVGGGNAALCAAITAAEAGARVLLLESAPKALRGGNSRHTRNLRYLHDGASKYLSGPYPEREFLDDLLRVTGGETDEELARLTIRRSRDLGGWMEAHGVRFQPGLRGTLGLSRTNAFFLGGGKALVNAYCHTAAKLGIEIAYRAEVTGLRVEDGAFRSAMVRTPSGNREIPARAVVVASGGFQANLEWLKEAWGPAAENFIIRGSPYNRGRVLRALIDNGARVVGDPSQCHAVAIDARAPKFDGGIVTRLDCVPFGIVVNRECERFYDEGEDLWPKRYAIWGRLVARQPDQIAYVILDRKAEGLYMPSMYPRIEADSLAGLASALGLDALRLQGVVQAFNRSVQSGEFDPAALDGCRTAGLDLPKSHWARRIDEAPFFAYPLRPGITFTYMGARVNSRAQVVMDAGEPSANIFAAGEVMSGNVLGRGYLAGLGMTIGTVFGRLAGTWAAHVAAGGTAQ